MNGEKLSSKREGQQLSFVPVEKVWWDKRYRTDLGDIESLAASFKEKGVLQPITVTPEFELLAGERRITAAKLAQLTHIPALIRKKEDVVDAREIELMENVFRKDPNWDEECALIQEIDRLYKEKHLEWSGRKTAQLLGKGVASVSRALQLARAAEVIPELRDAKDAAEAFKLLKNFEEHALVTEMRRRQDATLKDPNHQVEFGLREIMEIADANYHVGDTFQGLAELRSGGMIDIIECDPPYGIDLEKVKSSKDAPGSTVTGYNEVSQETYPGFLMALSKELFRVAKANAWLIFWFGPTWHHEVITSLREAGWHVDDIPAVWIKTQGQTLQPEIYLARAYEPFFLCRKGNPVMMKRGHLNVFSTPTVPAASKYHPTERPVALLEEVFELLAGPMAVVLVPFLGSGATLRACYNLGMSAFGWDNNPAYKDRFMLAVEEDTKKLNRNEE